MNTQQIEQVIEALATHGGGTLSHSAKEGWSVTLGASDDEALAGAIGALRDSGLAVAVVRLRVTH